MPQSNHVGTAKPLLSSTTYNYLKYTVQIALPALGTLYFTLASIWGLPYGEQVVGTITAVALFGGILIGVSKNQYEKSDAAYDGTVVATDDRDVPLFEFNEPFENIVTKKELKLKIDNQTSQ